MKNAHAISPVIKWVGGKRGLLPELLARLPASLRTYHEPFLGGGALFCALRPASAHLADTNAELVTLYRVIKAQPLALMQRVRSLPCDEAGYYDVRQWDRQPGFADLPPVDRAARFLYLNKTSFNGLWRVNRHGHVNAAWGKRCSPTLFSVDNVMALHHALRTARLGQAGFADLLKVVNRGDFVYFDPPYDSSEENGFVGYTAAGFDRDDQMDLWRVCVKLHRLGVNWMLSNADTAFIRRLYRAFKIEAVAAPRRVSRDAAGRRAAAEVIVRNY
ncbi:MAG: Dam family site-specific DNA-(adenine-N6)-methyltransferase [Rhodospirillaceae bacterium]|nr:Dam family site-specific DNA-(adenine-N6)-methyltransferase [Rhodospirillales bacterium]